MPGGQRMNLHTARERILIHGGCHPEASPEDGFLGSLRPYRGLDADSYHDLMACLRALAPMLRASESLDRELANALFGIAHYVRAWALHPEGMLRRNDLIAGADRMVLEAWLDAYTHAVACLLDGQEVALAFEPYGELD